MEFEAFKSSLIEKLEMINVKIDEHQAKQFYDYMNLLIEWNEKINLTAITKPEEIILKHFVDSLTIAKEIKEKFPDKTVWLYSGFSWEEFCDIPEVKYLDVVADGEFIEELKDVRIPWVGSSNQRVIDVQKSLASGEVCLYKK